MYEREIPLEYYTERGVEPPGLSFTSADMAEWDEDDRASALLAMENDMAQRHYAEIHRLNQEITRLQDILSDNGIEPYCRDEEDEPWL